MSQASSLRFKEDRILATYRSEEAARYAAAEITDLDLGKTHPIQSQGNMFVFGVTIQPGHKVTEYLDVFGLKGAARDAVQPHAARAVLAADAKHAGFGLMTLTHEPKEQEPAAPATLLQQAKAAAASASL
jgi:hypothetical protein